MSPLWGSFIFNLATQRLRAGLTSFAPPALDYRDGLGIAEADGCGVGLAVSAGVACGDATGVALAPGVTVGEAAGVAVALGDGEPAGVADTCGLALGVGLGLDCMFAALLSFNFASGPKTT